MWFLYDKEGGGFTTHSTEKEARYYLKSSIEYLTQQANDAGEWDGCENGIMIGEIKETTYLKQTGDAKDDCFELVSKEI